jgi:hypothetical protein
VTSSPMPVISVLSGCVTAQACLTSEPKGRGAARTEEQ